MYLSYYRENCRNRVIRKIWAINTKHEIIDREKKRLEDFGSSGAICLQEGDILLSGWGQVVSRRRKPPRRINPLPTRCIIHEPVETQEIRRPFSRPLSTSDDLGRNDQEESDKHRMPRRI